MVYVVSKDRKTSDAKIFECQNKHEAKEAIEDNWNKYSPIAIIFGTRLDFIISYEDVEETITKKKPKVDITN